MDIWTNFLQKEVSSYRFQYDSVSVIGLPNS